MPTRYLQVVHPRSRFARWAWGPTIVLRIALVGSYIIAVYAATLAFIAGVPVFDLTTPAGYTVFWATLMGGSALVAAVASINDKWQRVEKWAALFVVSTLLTYVFALTGVAFGEHDITRQFVSAVAGGWSLLFTTRFVYLAAQTGKIRRHATPSH